MTIAQAHVKTKFWILEDQDDVRNLDNSDKAQAVCISLSSPACFRHPPARPSLFCITQAEEPNLPTPSCDLFVPSATSPPSIHPPTQPRLPPLINRREEKKRKRKEENYPPCSAAMRSGASIRRFQRLRKVASQKNQMGVRAEAESRKVPNPISRCLAH